MIWLPQCKQFWMISSFPNEKDSLTLRLHSMWGGQYEDEYEVLYVDLQQDIPADVRLFERTTDVHGIIAQPMCTEFAGCGARWRPGFGETVLPEEATEELFKALALVDACMRIIMVHDPEWWVLENPVGRLTRWLGPWQHTYQPNEYGDPYTKRTCLWGKFNMPVKWKSDWVEPTEGSKMHLMAPSPERANLRAASPPGFCAAFRRANP